MSKRDFYEILGVAKTADEKALKVAYRKLAMEFHPDRNPGDDAAEAKFKEVGEAYAILSDGDKRAAYDRMGHAAFEQGGNGGNGGYGGQGPFGAGGAAEFADIFEQVFGDAFGRGGGRRGGGHTGPARGNDLRFDLEVSLEDAFHGKETTITVPTAMNCERCDGQGNEPGTTLESCPTCQGAGRIRRSQGLFTMEQTCPQCGGRGQYVKTPCQECDGVGRVRKNRTLTVNIPSGVEDGTRIRLAGEGEAGARGGPRGDLYLFLSAKPHELFERDGPNLYCRTPASMVSAALGASIEVPTIDGGKAELKIPAGAQTGRRMRLRGKGMPRLRGGPRGDMVVELFVETPRNLCERQKELLKEFCSLSGEGCNPDSDGFFNKVKQFWDDVTTDDGRPNA